MFCLLDFLNLADIPHSGSEINRPYTVHNSWRKIVIAADESETASGFLMLTNQ